VGVGYRHACALAQGGSAWCWGENPQGELGNGTLDPAGEPTPVSGGHSYSTLSVGAFHTCGIAQAKIYCWGWNFSLPLGPGTVNLDAYRVPVAVAIPFAASAVEAGTALTCAVGSGSGAWCWGINSTAQLGRGVASDPAADPGRVEVIDQVSAIASGALNSIATHVCALDTDLVTWCWGSAEAGQVGAPATQTCELGGGLSACVSTPAPVDSEVAFVQLAPGRDHTCAIGEDGAVYCWGSDARRQLGGTLMGGQSIAPVRVPMG
jgi:alpha-tubulin suppressor-like RCC1 family protein